MPDDWHIIDDETGKEDRQERRADEPDDRLNALRIRAIANERRALHRRLLWSRAIVLFFASAAAVMATDAFRAPRAKAIWYAIAAAVFAVLTVRAAMRSRRFRHPSATVSEVPTPSREAFNQLSNGEQFSRSLDELNR